MARLVRHIASIDVPQSRTCSSPEKLPLIGLIATIAGLTLEPEIPSATAFGWIVYVGSLIFCLTCPVLSHLLGSPTAATSYDNFPKEAPSVLMALVSRGQSLFKLKLLALIRQNATWIRRIFELIRLLSHSCLRRSSFFDFTPSESKAFYLFLIGCPVPFRSPPLPLLTTCF